MVDFAKHLLAAREREGRVPVTKQNVDDVFTYHAPTPEQQVHYQELRIAAHDFALAILDHTPVCADQQAALRLVREAVMTANAAIALKGSV